jgi:hypothetical protein
MSDFMMMEQRAAERRAESKAFAAQYQYRPPPARGLVSWLRRLIGRSKPQEEVKEPSVRPAYR